MWLLRMNDLIENGVGFYQIYSQSDIPLEQLINEWQRSKRGDSESCYGNKAAVVEESTANLRGVVQEFQAHKDAIKAGSNENDKQRGVRVRAERGDSGAGLFSNQLVGLSQEGRFLS